MRQANSAEEHKLISSFEAIKRTLQQEEYRERLDKPLAYWALPNDRRLPLAFLGRSIGELLATPFAELTATRGIGQKKISSLVRLLHRATSDAPPSVPYGIKELAEEMAEERTREVDSGQSFEPTLVSEALWVQWCETVTRFHLGQEPLGRLAPSLQDLPTVIWTKPLSEYAMRPLSEIRNLKTHGEKRIRVVLEVFHAVHELLHNTQDNAHLSLRLVPKFVPLVESYIRHILHHQQVASREGFVNNLLDPVLKQILTDSGETVYRLACHRLGVGTATRSVRELSQEMGVTRARVYQLLEDCAKVIEIRWPDGITTFSKLEPAISEEVLPTYAAAKQLFFGASA